ncbi:MAG: RDD family protein [Clostridia bacterium]|nr:RDD family protein [Clostridia bacterium]
MTELQKASMWKRISAFMFDTILLGVVAVLLAWLLSVALGFDGYYATVQEGYAAYSQAYGVDLNMGMAEYEALSAEQMQALEAASAALAADETVARAYAMVVQLALTITSLGIFLAYIIMEFTVPMALGNGQTIGKKMFSIALMGKDSVRIRPVQLFVRTVLGKYAVETMIPVLIVLMIFLGVMQAEGTILLSALALGQLILVGVTKNNSPLHDLLASTVAVDMGSQMIFGSKEELLEYKTRKHAEEVRRREY